MLNIKKGTYEFITFVKSTCIMIKKILFSLIVLVIASCTNLDERHVFNYTITGTAEKISDFYVVMGPGIEYERGEEEELPIDIKHDVYGTDLKYVLQVEHTDLNADVTIKVIIDDVVIEEKSEFELVDGVPTMRIEGVFDGD